MSSLLTSTGVLCILQVCCCLVFWAVPCTSVGQSARHDQEIQPNGWRVPNIQRLKVTNEAVEDHEGRTVRRRDYLLGRTKPVTRIGKNHYCEFATLSGYQYRGKTFAISGQCGCFKLDVSRLKKYTVYEKSYAACVTNYTFYDQDGDGRFESRYNSTYHPQAPPKAAP